MEFSLFYFADDSTGAMAHGGRTDRFRLLLDGARFADRHGFSAVWTPERHFHPFGGNYPNPAVTGAALATITENVRIRAGSVVAPLHDPIRIAEEWAVVDNLSGGRVEVSFASGWHPTDFALRPENYGDRRDLTTSMVETVQRLWRGAEVERLDGKGRPVNVRVYPPPVQSELPIWLTSAGSTGTFKAAGVMGVGVLTHLLQQDLPTLAANIAEYRAALGDRSGRVALMLHTYVGADTEQARATIREPLRAYLASSMELFTGASAASAGGIDETLRGEMLDNTFQRYFDSCGLFGSVEHAAVMVERVRAIGVDEVACLIDFGVPTNQVLDSLRYLSDLRAAVNS